MSPFHRKLALAAVATSGVLVGVVLGQQRPQPPQMPQFVRLGPVDKFEVGTLEAPDVIVRGSLRVEDPKNDGRCAIIESRPDGIHITCQSNDARNIEFVVRTGDRTADFDIKDQTGAIRARLSVLRNTLEWIVMPVAATDAGVKDGKLP